MPYTSHLNCPRPALSRFCLRRTSFSARRERVPGRGGCIQSGTCSSGQSSPIKVTWAQRKGYLTTFKFTCANTVTDVLSANQFNCLPGLMTVSVS